GCLGNQRWQCPTVNRQRSRRKACPRRIRERPVHGSRSERQIICRSEQARRDRQRSEKNRYRAKGHRRSRLEGRKGCAELILQGGRREEQDSDPPPLPS